MKIVYATIIGALLATAALAQASHGPQLTGNGEFCLVTASKGDCKFSSAESCQKARDASTSKDINSSCIIRREVQ